MMTDTTPTHTDPIVAALATLTAAGISFRAVDRCPDAACRACATRLAPAA